MLTKKIYLADDDADDAMLFSMALREVSHDCKLTVCHDGLEITEELNDCKELPDLIFLDLNMPVVCGLTALEKIRKMYPDKKVPVIIYSTSSNTDHIQTAYKLRADYFFVKPFDYAVIKKRIRFFLSLKWTEKPRTTLADFVIK